MLLRGRRGFLHSAFSIVTVSTLSDSIINILSTVILSIRIFLTDGGPSKRYIHAPAKLHYSWNTTNILSSLSLQVLSFRLCLTLNAREKFTATKQTKIHNVLHTTILPSCQNYINNRCEHAHIINLSKLLIWGIKWSTNRFNFFKLFFKKVFTENVNHL